MYFILMCPEGEEPVCQVSYYPDNLDIDWCTGAPMPPSLATPIEAVIEPGDEGVFPDLIEVPLPLMSRRLMIALKAAGVDNAQYFPTRIAMKASGRVVEDMVAFNVVGAVAAADKSASRFKDEGGIGVISVSFDELVLNESAACGLKLFRLAEFTQSIVVHETVRDALLTAGISNLEFIEPADWAN